MSYRFWRLQKSLVLWLWPGLILAAISSAHAQDKPKIRVACVGDNITVGSDLPDREETSYPAILAKILGDDYEVTNFGHPDATVNAADPNGYQKSKEFKDAIKSQPNIVLIMLGTNDSTARLGLEDKLAFTASYSDLIDAFSKLDSKPLVVLILPIPIYGDGGLGLRDTSRMELTPLIKNLAKSKKLPLIDITRAVSGHPDWFPDQVHPDTTGTEAMARAIEMQMPTPDGTRPTAVITSPRAGGIFLAPGPIRFEVEATSSESKVASVEFFCDGEKIWVATKSPYIYDWTKAEPGDHVLYARVVDERGLSRTTEPLPVMVTEVKVGNDGVPYVGGTYRQNFNSLARTTNETHPWIDNQTIPGWFVRVNSEIPKEYTVSDGTSLHSVMSLGKDGEKNRSIGVDGWGQKSSIGICLINATGHPFREIRVGYNAKQWHNSPKNKSLIVEIASPADGMNDQESFFEAPSLEWESSSHSKSDIDTDGESKRYLTHIEGSISIPGGWGSGAKLWLKWSNGPDQGANVSIDDVTIKAGENDGDTNPKKN